MDRGPWLLFHSSDGKLVGVISDDFQRDVVLRVDGDFADGEQKLAYCEWLRSKLNATPEQQSAGECSNCRELEQRIEDLEKYS